MWKLTKRSRQFILLLILISVLLLASCTTTSYNSFCPVYPIAGEKVAKELENAGDLPHTWEWIGRINKLKQELDLCQKR